VEYFDKREALEALEVGDRRLSEDEAAEACALEEVLPSGLASL